MHRYIKFMAIPLGLLAALPFAPARAQVGGPISDFMVMRVCTASSSSGAAILPGVAPGDTACVYSRQIAAGETPPYTLRDFAPNYIANAAPSCPGTFGPLLRANAPVTISGVTRIVSFSQTGTNTTCATAGTIGTGAGLTDTSVQSSDTTTGYGFIMGSSGPNGISLNDAYNVFANGATTGGIPSTPVCHTSTPYIAARFANSWLIGLSTVSASLPGPIQFAEVNLQNITPDTYTADQTAGIACSTPYVSSFHIWRADWFMFFSGRQLPAVIASHYTQAASNNAGPGASQQMERTYWTREFGLSRWEKWTRDDLSVGGVAPNVTAKTLLSHATCAQVGRAAGSPYPIVTNPADSHTSTSMTLSSVNGVYQKVVGPDGTTHSWYMTLCADYTNIDRSTTGQSLPSVPAVYDVLWTP
jgi:hypothetical protein